MKRRAMVSLLLLGAFSAGCTSGAVAATPCELRAALVEGNAAQARRLPTGELRGVAVDVAEGIARRWGRRLTIVSMTPPQMLKALANSEVDLGFIAIAPERGGAVRYSRPYMLVEQTMMVRMGSGTASVKDLDRPGVKLGVNRGDSVGQFLSREWPRAELVLSDDFTLAEAVEWVRTGHIVGFAANRQRLVSAVQRSPDVTVLPDNLYFVQQAIAVRQADGELLAAVDRALDEISARGELQRAIARSGTVGVVPARRSPARPSRPVRRPGCTGPA